MNYGVRVIVEKGLNDSVEAEGCQEGGGGEEGGREACVSPPGRSSLPSQMRRISENGHKPVKMPAGYPDDYRRRTSLGCRCPSARARVEVQARELELTELVLDLFL